MFVSYSVAAAMFNIQFKQFAELLIERSMTKIAGQLFSESK